MNTTTTALAAAILLGVSAATPATAQINLTAGDVAVIGWTDNAVPEDLITIVNLAPLPAGTTLYFTDNGWTGSAYRNTLGSGDGDGNEQLLQFTANALIPAGTIITSSDASASFTWLVATPINGASGSLDVPALAQAGDQIAAFQHDTGVNPLNTTTQQHVFVIDDTGVFEPATTSNEGDVPTGLSVAANTAITFDQDGTGQNFMAFNTAALASGTKADWLAAIANVANWSFSSAGTLPSGTITVGGGSGAGAAYCFGDGSGLACPCGNAGAAGNGCANSTNAAGGNLIAGGTPSLAGDTLVLTGSGMPNSSALYFQGTSQQAGGQGVAFGDGLRCAGGTIVRLGTKNNLVGTSQYPAAGDASVSVRGLVGAPGVRVYQCWYRNAAAFCTESTFNLTNGWEVTWTL